MVNWLKGWFKKEASPGLITIDVLPKKFAWMSYGGYQYITEHGGDPEKATIARQNGASKYTWEIKKGFGRTYSFTFDPITRLNFIRHIFNPRHQKYREYLERCYG